MGTKQTLTSEDIISVDKWNLACLDIETHAPIHLNEINKLKNQLLYKPNQKVQFQEKDKLILKTLQESINTEQLEKCVHFRLLCNTILRNNSHSLPTNAINKLPITSDIMLGEVASYLDWRSLSALKSTCSFFHFNSNLGDLPLADYLKTYGSAFENVKEFLSLYESAEKKFQRDLPLRQELDFNYKNAG